MHAYLWIVTSWIVVAVICYFWLAFSGNGTANSGASTRRLTSNSLAMRTGEWFNEVVHWLWRSRRLSSAFADVLTKALNESFARISKTSNANYEIRFELPLTSFTKTAEFNRRASTRLDPRAKISNASDDAKNAPYIEHINAISDENAGEHLIVNARLHIPRLTLKLCVTESSGDPKTSTRTATHELLFTDLHGEIEARVAPIAEELFVMGCFSGRPEMHVKVTPTNADASTAHNAAELEELARRCLVSSVLNFNMGEILYPESRRSSVRLSAEARNLSMLNDVYALNNNNNENFIGKKQEQQQALKSEFPRPIYGSLKYKAPNRLLVHLLGARNLGQNQTPQRPYVTVEVDEPVQKFVSGSDLNGRNPQWNQTFEININAASKELLFEVYDGDASDADVYGSAQYDGSGMRLLKTARKFLGLAIVGVDELSRADAQAKARTPTTDNASQPFVHQLQLQARPYAQQEANGRTTFIDASRKNGAEANVVSGVLLIQCQLVHAPTDTQRTEKPAKFPTFDEKNLRGTLKNFDQNYIYNTADYDQQDQSRTRGQTLERPTQQVSSHSPKSPTSSDWANFNEGNTTGEILSNRSLSRSQSSHLNSSILLGRPDSAMSKLTSVSLVQPPSVAAPSTQAESRTPSLHNSSRIPPPLQVNQQYSPYDRFVDPIINRSSSNLNVNSLEKPLEPHLNRSKEQAHLSQNQLNRASPLTPISPTSSQQHVQFINRNGPPKHGSPFRTTSEKVVGAEAWTPALHASSIAAISPIRPGIFDFPPTQKSIEISAQMAERNSPQPPPVPPHHQSRLDEELARQEKRTNEAQKDLNSPLKSHRDESSSKTRRERSFFDGLRERLIRGSMRLGKSGSQRARSLDTENAELEEAAVSMPASRDQSQVRGGTKLSAEAISVGENMYSTTRSSRPGRDTTAQSMLILEVVDSENDGGDKTNAKQSQKYHKLKGGAEYGDEEDRNGLLNGDDTNEPHQMRYYLIPSEVASQPAAQSLLRAGKKLHVFKNHTFVAVKPRGRVPCSVCGRIITSNFTKQAYQCRDCRKVTHKSCHLRGTSPCRESNLSHLPIINNVNWSDFLRQYQMHEFISVDGV